MLETEVLGLRHGPGLPLSIWGHSRVLPPLPHGPGVGGVAGPRAGAEQDHPRADASPSLGESTLLGGLRATAHLGPSCSWKCLSRGSGSRSPGAFSGRALSPGIMLCTVLPGLLKLFSAPGERTRTPGPALAESCPAQAWGAGPERTRLQTPPGVCAHLQERKWGSQARGAFIYPPVQCRHSVSAVDSSSPFHFLIK